MQDGCEFGCKKGTKHKHLRFFSIIGLEGSLLNLKDPPDESNSTYRSEFSNYSSGDSVPSSSLDTFSSSDISSASISTKRVIVSQFGGELGADIFDSMKNEKNEEEENPSLACGSGWRKKGMRRQIDSEGQGERRPYWYDDRDKGRRRYGRACMRERTGS